MIGWIDTNGCSQNFHCFKTDSEGKKAVYHADNSVCEEAEYSIKEGEEHQ